MSLEIDQTGRLLTLEFDGELSKTLIPVVFSGREALSELYSYTIDVVSPDMSLAASSILGHNATAIVTLGQIKRRFTGIVSRFSPGLPWGRDYRAYQLEIVPKLWLATLNARCRSFKNQSAFDTVNQVLKEYGISASLRGAGTAARSPREYCLQYFESDYAFVSRLLEEEGLFFYFPPDHANANLTLVDALNGTFEVTGDELRFGPHEAITAWSHDIRAMPQGVTYHDYDFKQAAVVTGTATAAHKLSNVGTQPVETHASNVLDTSNVQYFADIYMQELEQDYETFSGESGHPAFAPGGRFKHDRDSDASSDTVMLSMVEHHATCHTHISTQAAPPEYRNKFSCRPIDAKVRPPRRHRRNRAHGPQTATVSSDPDEYGRIKVQFHWGDQLESGWARLAMPWAYNQMGFQFIPRVNSEVVIDFLEGDPERPIIVGSVYNGMNKLLYTLPDNKTQSGIRGDTGNELKFEDKSGSEFINFTAQKDFTRTVKNNDKLTVTQNRDVVIEQGNLSIKVNAGTSTMEAAQSIELKVGSNSLKIDQQGISLNGMNIKIEGSINTQVKGAAMTSVEASGQLTLKGALTMIN